MRYDAKIIGILFILFLIVSVTKSELSTNITFRNIPHTTDIFDSSGDHSIDNFGDQGSQTNPTITNEMLSWEMIRLSWGILIFGLILILSIMVFALKKETCWDREMTRIFTVSVVVTAGLFLMTAGYTDKQVAPMFGLLGTMIGYILGKSSSEEPAKSGP